MKLDNFLDTLIKIMQFLCYVVYVIALVLVIYFAIMFVFFNDSLECENLFRIYQISN